MTGTKSLEVGDAIQVVLEEQKERSAKETEVLKQMRDKIAVLDPESKDTDDATLLRFLRARAMDVTKASKMFADHQRWRRQYFPLGHVQVADIKDEISANKYFIQGRDRQGRPLSLFIGAKHFPNKNHEQYKKGVTLLVDKLIASLPPGEEKFSIIVDLKSVKFKNLDVRGWLASYECLQAYYPERLGKVFVLHAPTIFWGAWKMMVPFLDPVTKAKEPGNARYVSYLGSHRNAYAVAHFGSFGVNKIMFVDSNAVEATLLKDISKEEIPTVYGGLKELVPFEAAQPPNWPMFKPTTQIVLA